MLGDEKWGDGIDKERVGENNGRDKKYGGEKVKGEMIRGGEENEKREGRRGA